MVITTNRLIASLFLILLIGAAVFSYERILFADASFILFRLINEGSLQIQEHRYGSFITQGIPLLSARLHLPLPVIVVLYSLSFNLFYLSVALLLLYHFRNTSLSILMAFYFVLFVSDTFFWTNNEVHQGIGWMFLLFATTFAFSSKETHWAPSYLAFVLLSFLTLYTHPLLIFPVSYLWLFYLAGKEWSFSRVQTVGFTATLVLIGVSKLLLSAGPSSHYDADKLYPVTHLSTGSVLSALTSPFAKEVMQRLLADYWIVPVLFAAGLWETYRKKAYKRLILTICYVGIYFLALCLTFNDFTAFYTESELMPATLMLTAPFVYYVIPNLRQKATVTILIIIFLVRLAYIGHASEKWVERKKWLMSTLQTMEEKQITKAFVFENSQNKKLLMLTWGTPIESIIASSLKGDSLQKTFVVEQKENLPGRMPSKEAYMISSFGTIDYKAINEEYFRFDTTASYQVLQVK